MRLKKIIISVCLLLAYSIGLAHDLIPHCHHSGVAEEIAMDHDEHHHQHHEHESDEPVDHEHIEHADHLDDGLLDFIICILDETEHPASEENQCYYVPFSSNNMSSQWLNNTKLAVVLVSIFNTPSVEDVPPAFQTDILIDYLPPPLSSSPHRGPPFVFC